MDISKFQQDCFETAADHGWWPMSADEGVGGAEFKGEYVDLDKVNVPEKIALMHSELSEALEHYRNLGEMKFRTPVLYGADEKPDGFWVELGDCIIRILDLAGAYGVDLEYALRVKAEYNKTRPYRHGDKKC